MITIIIDIVTDVADGVVRPMAYCDHGLGGDHVLIPHQQDGNSYAGRCPECGEEFRIKVGMDWIDERVRKPAHDLPVLVYVPEVGIHVGQYSLKNGKVFWQVGEWWPVRVTHWMPLPPSPDYWRTHDRTNSPGG
jgi:hypothetical protein